MRRGLTITQAFVLLLTFVAGSAVIFLLGVWVGEDLAEQRRESEEQVVRIAVTPLLATETPATSSPAAPTPTRTPLPLLSFSPVPTVPSAPAATPTRAAPSPTATAAPTQAPASGPLVVVAGAGPDPVEAVMLRRRLQSLGFEARVSERRIAGVVWYRVEVGPFRNREDAEEAARRLKSEAAVLAPQVVPEERP